MGNTVGDIRRDTHKTLKDAVDRNSPKSISRVNSAVRSSAGSVIRSALSTGKWLRRAIWIWPIIAAVILGGVGLVLRSAVERNIQLDTESRMETILNAEVAALTLWVKGQEKAATTAAVDPLLISETEKLLQLPSSSDTLQLDLLQTPELEQLRSRLTPLCEASDYQGWVIVSPEQQIMASARNENVGVTNPKGDQRWTERALLGAATVSPPRKSLVLLLDDDGERRAGVPTMFVWAPIRNTDKQVIAALGFRIPPHKEFTEILRIARFGQTGETYAIASDGRMISGSRFDQELRETGLLSEDEDSILNIMVCDPGVNMADGGRPALPRSDQPLTKAAREVLAGSAGQDMTGYRDYRGISVIGCWIWLPQYEIGLITEQGQNEAFAILGILRRVFWSLFALLGVAAAAILGFMVSMQRQQRVARRSALEVRRLGQYSLEEKLGEGGMGTVYRGHHAMLHRPTAIKFLNIEKTNEHAIARFEREVKLTARLSHPNTIAIYDYGRTPEGIFYYAMECLEGIDLENLVKQYGPLPEARVVHFLKQVCGSLTEAHSIGLIHRDIKPANIFITTRGGIHDFVKVLDFGLVKALDEQKQAKLTSTGAMAGTPLYLAPEAIERPDTVNAQSDLYAVGAVGYFLLTGTPVFDAANIVQILQKHITSVPDALSKRLGKPVSKPLEDLLMKCLAKSQSDRPGSAAELYDALDSCSVQGHWSAKDAALWWSAATSAAKTVKDQANSRTSAISETIITTKITAPKEDAETS